MCIANFYTSFIQLFVLTLQLECFQHKAFRVTPAITEAFGFFLLCLNPLAILKNNISSCFIFIRWLAGTLVTSQRSIQPPSIPKLQYQDGWLKKGNWLAVVWNLPSTRCLADFVLNKANISELREQHLVAVLHSGTSFANTLARSPYFPIQFHHFHDGLLAPAAHVVERAVVLFGQAVQHAEHVTTATWSQFLLY